MKLANPEPTSNQTSISMCTHEDSKVQVNWLQEAKSSKGGIEKVVTFLPDSLVSPHPCTRVMGTKQGGASMIFEALWLDDWEDGGNPQLYVLSSRVLNHFINSKMNSYLHA